MHGSMLLDAHVHVYPFYNAGALLDSAMDKLAALASPGDALGIVLVEREGQDVFGAWSRGENLPPRWSAAAIDPAALRLRRDNDGTLAVFAGRQIACAERLEILGIGTRAPIPDGVPCREAIDAILADGGLPALAWGVGKWLFGRARIVRDLLAAYPPETLPLCDTSLRPVFWPRPAAMRDPRRPVLCGSDPLPRAGEETQAGRYASAVSADVAGSDPTAQLLRALRLGGVRPVGHRSSPLEFLRRH